MNLLILLIGILVGILISGSIFVYLVLREEPDNKSIKAMKDYIFELEEENKELKTQVNKLKEALRKT